MRRYGLRDDRWDRIKDFLPDREGHVGGTAADIDCSSKKAPRIAACAVRASRICAR
jgi:hypothetical protein